MQWLQTHASVISAIASLGTLTIWAVYLHIFVSNHQRQIKPMLVINRGEGRTLDARCLVTNMSQDPVHIQSVLAKITAPGGEYTAYITDAEDVRYAGNPSGWERMTRQGPLASGMMVDMGSFAGILDYAAQSCCGHQRFEGSELCTEATTIEITILGIYGSEDLLIGASRKFEIDQSKKEIELRAKTTQTRQITRAHERKRLAKELSAQL